MNEHTLLALLGIASVATTFAGFSGVVAVFGGRALGNWAPVERTRMTNLVIMSLSVCFFSFVPIALDLLGVSDGTIWVCSSLGLTFFSGSYFVFSVLNTQALLHIRRSVVSPWVRIAFMVLLPAITVLQISNVLGFGFKPGPGPLVTGLLLILALAGIQFAHLVLIDLRSKGH
jgi:hypothetical protein